MRLLTLNTHSQAEENYDDKCDIFVNSVIKLKPDVIAMQEVNQSIDAEVLDKESNLKADNHGLKVLNKLKEKNANPLTDKRPADICFARVKYSTKK